MQSSRAPGACGHRSRLDAPKQRTASPRIRTLPPRTRRPQEDVEEGEEPEPERKTDAEEEATSEASEEAEASKKAAAEAPKATAEASKTASAEAPQDPPPPWAGRGEEQGQVVACAAGRNTSPVRRTLANECGH